jgi:Amt family ammonium transporter
VSTLTSSMTSALEAQTRRRIPLNAKRLAVGAAVGVGTLLIAGGTALAQTTSEAEMPDMATTAATADHAIQSGNLVWIVIGAALVIFMQAGFALVETGFCRAKHAAHVVSTNLAIFFLGFVAFFLIGFPLMFGGYSYVLPGFDYGLSHPVGSALIGSGDWVFLWKGGFAGTWFDGSNLAFSGAAGAFFLYMVAFMDTTATIPTGSMAERWRFKSFVMWGLFCGAIYYPIFGAWTWGGGWLAKLGNSMSWGSGYVDFAGSGVVHAMGGAAALAGAIVLGPRIGKFGKDGKPRALPGHHIPMAMLGTFILLFGWFGFNAASTFASSDPQIGVVAVNTALAAAFGGFSSMLWIWWRTGKPDPAMMANGMLAGLVIITAPCAFVDPWVAAALGLFAGIVVIESVFFIERRLKIDDPVGAISVHGVCGILGVLAVGVVANGKYGIDASGAGIGWNGTTTSVKDGVAEGVTGLFYGGNGGGQFLSQLAGALTICIVMFGLAYAFFKIQNALTKGGIRPPAEEEIAGLDIPEMGVLAYPDFAGTHEGLVTSDA